MMISFLEYYFAPSGQPFWTGQIWPNILASILCGLSVFMATKFLVKLIIRQHAEHLQKQTDQMEELSNSLAQLHSKINKQNGEEE